MNKSWEIFKADADAADERADTAALAANLRAQRRELEAQIAADEAKLKRLMHGGGVVNYRTRTQRVQAILFDGDVEKAKAFLGETLVDGKPDHIGIDSPEAFYIAYPGYYLLKDSSGNFSAMEPEMFATRFEEDDGQDELTSLRESAEALADAVDDIAYDYGEVASVLHDKAESALSAYRAKFPKKEEA